MIEKIKNFLLGFVLLFIAFGVIMTVAYFTAIFPAWLVIPGGVLFWILCENIGKDWREDGY